jgi:hypothetical protein
VKRSRIKAKPTRRGPEAQRQFDEFKAEWTGRPCCLCERQWMRDIHHIAKRKGDAWDDPRNLLAVCGMCHARIDADQHNINGRLLRQWTDEDVERAKRRWDPDNWDPAYLDYLRNWERHYRETGRTEYETG